MLGGMLRNSHLMFRETSLPPAAEWNVKAEGWLFLRVCQGEGYLLHPTPPQLIGESAVLVVAPGSPCSFRASQLGELRMQYFQVIPELMAGILTSFERQHFESVGPGINQIPASFAANSSFAEQFASLGRLVVSGHSLVARGQMLCLASAFFAERLPAQHSKQTQFLSAKDRFTLLIQEMPEAGLQHQSPEELARVCGCSVRHFSRLFRGHFGQSFVPKRIELCLQKAKQLLEETDAKIIDVALDCGFQHVGLFGAVFKRHFGLTPSAWRKRQNRNAKIKRSRKGRRLVRTLALTIGMGAASYLPGL